MEKTFNGSEFPEYKVKCLNEMYEHRVYLI